MTDSDIIGVLNRRIDDLTVENERLRSALTEVEAFASMAPEISGGTASTTLSRVQEIAREALGNIPTR